MYGDKFADEIHPDLRFVGAGILAMANSGPNTNGGSKAFLTVVSGLIHVTGSQFFITCVCLQLQLTFERMSHHPVRSTADR